MWLENISSSILKEQDESKTSVADTENTEKNVYIGREFYNTHGLDLSSSLIVTCCFPTILTNLILS